MRSDGIVCTPLRTEWAALRTAVSASVIRSGRGPTHRLGDVADPDGPIAVAGVAGALDTGLRPGDLVIADEIRCDGMVYTSNAAPLLHAAVRRLGLAAHLGPIFSAERVVDGAERARLAATGAIAVDTESAFLAAAAPPGQAVVLRTIVDTAALPLFRPGTPWRGLRALHALRAAATALDQWAAATGSREILLATDDPINRHRAVRAVAAEADLVLVLGSSNSVRLVELTAEAQVHLLNDIADLDLRWLVGAHRVGITADGSAPFHLVENLVRALSGLGPTTVRKTTVIDEDVHFTLPQEVS